jgi:hypothetical protein
VVAPIPVSPIVSGPLSGSNVASPSIELPLSPVDFGSVGSVGSPLSAVLGPLVGPGLDALTPDSVPAPSVSSKSGFARAHPTEPDTTTNKPNHRITTQPYHGQGRGDLADARPR